MLTGMTSLQLSGSVTCEVVDGVAQVRLARPDKLNALTLEMLDALVATARSLRRDPCVRAVVIAGEGSAFCAGLDLRAALRSPSGIATRFVPRPWAGTNTFQEACWAWRRLAVPVVAAVQGPCLGAGIQLALGADLRVTAPDAQWSVREARWGLVPDMTGTRTLTELVGLDVAKELTLTARIVDGVQAQRIGLATRVSDDPLGTACDLVGEMVVNDRRALALGKALLDQAVTTSARRTFARERRAQLRLLAHLARSARADPSSLPGR